MLSSPEPVLLGRLLPLALGAAVSPLLLLLQLLNLSAPAQPLRRSAAFLLGCTLVMALWLLGAAWMAGLLAAVASGPVQLDTALDALFGLLLLAAAAWMLQSQPTSISSPSAQPRAGAQGGLAAAFAAGLAAMGCNLTSLVLVLRAMQTIVLTLPPSLERGSLSALLALATLLPAWSPPLVVLISGEPGRRWLQRLARWVQPRQHLINGAVALGLGLLLLGRAWGRV